MKHPARLADSEYVGPRVYFLTICAHKRRPLFIDAPVADLVMSHFLSTALERNVAILAYCLMPDHLHAVARMKAADGNFLEFVRVAKQRTAFAFRRRYAAPLWQPSFFDRTLRDTSHWPSVLAYVVANPIRAGLVSRVDDYVFWGSSTYSRLELLEFVARESRGRT